MGEMQAAAIAYQAIFKDLRPSLGGTSDKFEAILI